MKEHRADTGAQAAKLWERPLFHLLLIAATGLLVYSNTFYVPFFLSEHLLLDNPFVKDIGYPVEAARNLDIDIYNQLKHRYVALLTFALNYKLHGFEVFGYHLVNIALHLFNGLLVYALVALTLRTPRMEPSRLNDRRLWLALLCALVFVAHPLHTHAVNLVWQRVAVLAAFFCLASLACYLRARLEQQRAWRRALFYGLALCCAALAMKSKQNAFTMPFVIALFELVFFQGGFKARLRRLFPFALTLLIIPATYLFGMGLSPEQATKGVLPPGAVEASRHDYLLTQFTALASYLRRLLVPVKLPVYEDFALQHSFFSWPVAASFVLLATLLAAGIFLVLRSGRGGQVLVGCGLLWFFITNAVESSIVPISILFAHYRAYLPSVGFIIAAVAGGYLVMSRFGLERGRLAKGCALLLVLALGMTCYARNEVWRTEVSLARDVVRYSPDSATAHLILGRAYKRTGQLEEARREFDLAFRLDEIKRASEGQQGSASPADERIARLQSALKPGDAESHLALAAAYYEGGRYQEALDELERVTDIDPGHAGAHYAAGMIHHEQQRFEQAEAGYRQAVIWMPGFVAARTGLAGVLAQTGRYEEAIGELQTALRADPRAVEAHKFLGLVYQDLGRLDDAAAQFAHALRIAPDHAEVHNSLGEVFAQQGKRDEAIESFLTALRLNPEMAATRANLERLSKASGGQ